MPFCRKAVKFALTAGFALIAFPSLSRAQHYNQTNLVSNRTDQGAAVVDPNLKNPWGLTRSATSPFWVGNNNSGTSSLYANGSPVGIFPDPSGSKFDNFIFVPPPGFAPAGTQSAPTGVVFNGNPNIFHLNKGTPTGQPAIFLFATEDGTISGWNPVVNLRKGNKPPSIDAVLEVDNSDNGSSNSAVYKGMTSAVVDGQTFLYVTNFRSAEVEVYNSNFARVRFSDDAFKVNGDRDGDDHVQGVGDRIPAGFAPFNVQNIGGALFVTYAKQDAARHDPPLPPENSGGFVEIFTPQGKLIGHLQHGDWFDAPWGVVWTPRDFGRFSNSILVGNFRSGWIAAFNGFTHEFLGLLKRPDNSLVFIDGVWSLTFGNNGAAGSATTLFFTAGINLETDGLFGTLTPVPAEEDGSIE
jgi:uncharacterized protein (TIGR03118 family)